MSAADMDAEAGSFVIVYMVQNGGKYHVAFHHWDELDAAYAHWYERRIDRVLVLTGHSGSDIRLAASRISEICTSTPDQRAHDRALDDALKAEAGFSE